MKIYLSKGMRIGSLIFVLCMLSYLIFSIYHLFYYYDILMILSALFGDIVLFYFIFWRFRRHFSYVIPKDNLFSAYNLFNKIICTVDTNKPIYYSVFKAEDKAVDGAPKSYIAISNEPFGFGKDSVKMYKTRFLISYDFKKIIVMPYNSNTVKLLNLSEWEMI